MLWLLIKYAITAGMVVLSLKLPSVVIGGGLVAALPGYCACARVDEAGRTESAKIANHAWYTFWYVVPTLPMFYYSPFSVSDLAFGSRWVAAAS